MKTATRLNSALSKLWPSGFENLGEFPAIAMPMHMALDSYAAVIRHETSNVFAKAFHSEALAPYSFSGAVEAAEMAGEAGIGPKLVTADTANQVLIFEHLGEDWRVAMASDLQAGPLRENMIAAKRNWHMQPALSTAMSPFDVARGLATELAPKLDHGTLLFKGKLPFAAMRAEIDMIGQGLLAAGMDLHPVHGENTSSNVMIKRNNDVMLVDFDRAVMADPWWDIGALSLELCRTEAERIELVEIYAGRTEPSLLARMKLYALIDDFIWACWALLVDDGAETSGPELYKYANNRLIRFGYHIDKFEVPTLLGEI